MHDPWEMMEPAGAPQLYRVRKNGLLGIFHEREGLLVLGDWESIGDYRDGLAMVFKRDRNGKKMWGLIDEAGKVVTPCKWYYEDKPPYPELRQCSNGSFVNGYALVRDHDWPDDGYQILTREGTVIGTRCWAYFEELFDEEKKPIRVFSRNQNTGRLISYVEEEWCYDHEPTYWLDLYEDCIYENGFYYLTYDGTVLTPKGPIPDEDTRELPAGWKRLPAFSGSYVSPEAGVYLNRAGQISFRDPQLGDAAWWDEIVCLENGMVCVRAGGCWGVLNDAYELQIPCRWDRISLKSHYGLEVEKDGKYGILLPSGAELVPCQMEELCYDEWPSYRRGVLTKQNGLWGAFDHEGRQVVPCQWDRLCTQVGGYKAFRDGKCAFLDEAGRQCLSCAWEDLEAEFRGMIKVKSGGLWGLMDERYQQIVPCIWRKLEWEDNLIRVKKDGKWGLLDRSGKTVFPAQWEAYESCGRYFSKVKRDGRYGLIDWEGKEVLSCQWEDIQRDLEFEQFFLVKQDGKWGATDLSGKLVLGCQWDGLWTGRSEEFGQRVFYVKDDLAGDASGRILDLEGNELWRGPLDLCPEIEMVEYDD